MTPKEAKERLDELLPLILVPLRLEKRVVNEALDELCDLVVEQKASGLFTGSIDVAFAGTLWDIFCSMLAEADHARDPEPILDAAWRYQEELRQAFGPLL
jgi:hypothetical protein